MPVHRRSLERLIAQVWPGADAEDAAAATRTMSHAKRLEIRDRLEALHLLEAGEVTVGDAASRAGMSRSAFHAMRVRWSADRTIGSLIAMRGAGGAPERYGWTEIRKAVDPGADAVDRVLAKVVRVVSAHPAETNGAIGRILLADGVVDAAVGTAAGLVRDVRRAQRLVPEALRGAYGSRLLVDASATSMLVFDGDGEIRPMVAAFVVEGASGLVLAANAGVIGDCFQRQRRAVDQASRLLRSERLDRVGLTPSRLTYVAAWDDVHQHWPMPDPSRAFPHIDVLTDGARRAGGKLATILGKTVGGLKLQPRATMSAELSDHIPLVTPEPLLSADADWLLRRHVDAHNDAVRSVLATAGLSGDRGVPTGMMAATLEQVRSLF